MKYKPPREISFQIYCFYEYIHLYRQGLRTWHDAGTCCVAQGSDEASDHPTTMPIQRAYPDTTQPGMSAVTPDMSKSYPFPKPDPRSSLEGVGGLP